MSDIIKIVEMNLDDFDRISQMAASAGANILLFPEDSIVSGYIPRIKEPNVVIEEIPDPLNGTVHNPCVESEKYSKGMPILHRLSCMAMKNKIYIIADMGDFVRCSRVNDSNCPDDGHYQFNTAVAFNSDGYLIAKYHKMQLFYEKQYNPSPKPDLVYFDTPFGRMGLFICFDIVFRNPGTTLVSAYGVDTMLFPTWWFDALPFNSAVQMQQSFAITNNVNLLAANMHIPNTGTLGSGIYSGRRGEIVYTNIVDGVSKLLIADIPIKSENTNAKCYNSPNSRIIEVKEPVSYNQSLLMYNHFNADTTENMVLKRLTEKKDVLEVCSDGFCCGVNYTVESADTLVMEAYYLGVANRTTGRALAQAHYPVCEQICALFRCDGDLDLPLIIPSVDPSGDLDNECQTFPLQAVDTIFTNVQISAKFSTKYTYPSVVTNNLKLVPKNRWEYTNDDINRFAKLEINSFEKPILTAGFYGRCFDRDPPYKQ